MLKEVPITNFSKGIVLTSSKYAQPKGIVRTASNLLYTRRGALTTRDGDGQLFYFQTAGGPGTGLGRMAAIASYPPVQIEPVTVFLLNDPSVALTPIADLALSTSGTGLTGTYYYVVTAIDGGGVETTKSNEVHATVSNQSVVLTWGAVTNAIGYHVYRGTSSGSEVSFSITFNTTITDNGVDSLGTATPPSSNLTSQLGLFCPQNGVDYWRQLDLIKRYPATLALNGSQTYDGSGLAPSGGSGPCSRDPKFVIFAGSCIVALGNGYPPQKFTASSSGRVVIDVANSFVVAYPSWTASTAFLVGDYIQPTTANGYAYRCIQQGTSGGSEPSFPTGLNATVQDGNAIWERDNSTSVVAPRGADDAEVHEGALWLWNTYPSNTTDGLDGPCCLKMSNVLDPDQWNPINTAFVDKDDGEAGNGMASFTIAEFGIAPTGSLVLFKPHKTYQVTGIFGATDFAIQRAKTEMGCIAKRTIQFISGIGLIRLTHLGFAAFDGVSDSIISEEIRPYLFGGVSGVTAMDWDYAAISQSCANADPPGYCAAIPTIGSGGALDRIIFFDTVLRAWAIIDLSFSISCLNQVVTSSAQPVTECGAFSDGTIRRLQYGDSNSSVAWSFESPEVFEAGGSKNTYFRRILIRGTSTGGSVGAVSVTAEGKSFPCNMRSVPMPFSTDDFEIEATVHRRGTNFRASVSGKGGVEIESVIWHVEPAKAGSLVSTK